MTLSKTYYTLPEDWGISCLFTTVTLLHGTQKTVGWRTLVIVISSFHSFAANGLSDSMPRFKPSAGKQFLQISPISSSPRTLSWVRKDELEWKAEGEEEDKEEEEKKKTFQTKRSYCLVFCLLSDPQGRN